MTNKTPHRPYRLDALMRLARMRKFGNIHTKIDPVTGLQAIIAVHNTDLGPAIGGCRLYPYDSMGEALKDVLDLSYGMTIKAAISDLAHGGAKAVIIEPKHPYDRTAIFESFGDFVHQLNGIYITSCDIGTSNDEMNIIAKRTPYVIGATENQAVHSYPSPHTALGVYQGIRAAVKHRYQKDSLNDIHVSIQGVGNVGYHLCKLLHNDGARLTVCDTNSDNTDKVKTEFGATVVDIHSIYAVDADIFSPCARGGVITFDTMNQLTVDIIAGSANSQLAHQKYAALLKQRNILYAPDFLINSGGLINAAYVYDFQDVQMSVDHINELYTKLLNIFQRSEKTGEDTLSIANKMALDTLTKAREESIDPILKTLETIAAD